ncbi:MAG: hypothetical protein NTU79_08615 [Planctomycetota bacterium]|nr:hypothetical protein [Planctomycetota bacterium]
MPQTPEQLFIAGWKKAGPVLEEYRSTKLREMSPDYGARLLGAATSNEEIFYSHGLARWQAWMMRWRARQWMQAMADESKSP